MRFRADHFAALSRANDRVHRARERYALAQERWMTAYDSDDPVLAVLNRKLERAQAIAAAVSDRDALVCRMVPDIWEERGMSATELAKFPMLGFAQRPVQGTRFIVTPQTLAQLAEVGGQFLVKLPTEDGWQDRVVRVAVDAQLNRHAIHRHRNARQWADEAPWAVTMLPGGLGSLAVVQSTASDYFRRQKRAELQMAGAR